MKIATITLNPAIDQTVRVDNLETDAVNRGQSMQFDAGGKGVNVASFLTDYGFDVAVTGFLGEENPRLFEQLFAQKKIEDQFVRIPGRTRTNVKIVDETKQETTDINMKGATPPSEAVYQLAEKIEQLADTCDWFVLAGNLPPNVPDTINATLISHIKSLGKNVVLDSSRAALREGVLAGPTIVKPNIHELEDLVGHELVGETAVITAARQLLEYGTELVVVSMGAEGALFVDAHQVIQALPPKVTVKSTVGAGDAMVSGVVAGCIEQLPLADVARLATAFSVTAVTRVGAHIPSKQLLQTYGKEAKIKTIESISA